MSNEKDKNGKEGEAEKPLDPSAPKLPEAKPPESVEPIRESVGEKIEDLNLTDEPGDSHSESKFVFDPPGTPFVPPETSEAESALDVSDVESDPSELPHPSHTPSAHPSHTPHDPHGTAHAHPRGPRVDLKPEQFGGKWFGWLRGYREVREKGAVATAVDNTTRFSIGSGIGWGASWLSQVGGINWIATGWAPMKFGWIPGIGAIIGGGTLLARMGMDQARYLLWVRTKFEEVAGKAKLDTETEREALEYIRSEIEKNREKHSNQLLDTHAEQHIIQAFHKSGIAKPALVPYLRGEAQYAEYCFCQLTKLCEAAAEPHANIEGLNHHEIEELKKYHLANAADKEKIRKSLIEMCSVYARLVKNYHSDKREAQLYGAVVASSVSMLGYSGGLSILGGGVLLGARRFWTGYQKNKLHIELDSKGELVGKKKGKHREHMVPPELSRGEYTLVDHDIFHACAEMKAADLPDRAKKWLPRLVMPHHLHDMEFESAEEMGKEASMEVMHNLMLQTNLKKPGTEFEIKQAEKDYDAEAQLLRELEKELRELPQKISDAQAAYEEAEEALGAETPGEKSKRERVDMLKEDLGELQTRLARLQEKRTGLIASQRTLLNKAEKKYREAKAEYDLKKTKEEEVRQKNEDIRARKKKAEQEVAKKKKEIEARKKKGEPVTPEEEVAAAEVTEILEQIQPIEPVSDHDLTTTRQIYDEERQRLRLLQDELQDLPNKIEKAERTLRQAEAALGSESAEERGRRAKASRLHGEVRKLQNRKGALEGQAGQESLIDKQRARVAEVNKKFYEVKEGKESKEKLDIPTMLADEDLLKAFAVKIHGEFKHLKEKGKSKTLLGIAGNWMKDKAIEKAKEVGDVVVTSGIYGSIGGSAAAVIGGVFLSLNPWAAGLTVGALSAILTFAAKMRATKVKVETKKDDHGGHH